MEPFVFPTALAIELSIEPSPLSSNRYGTECICAKTESESTSKVNLSRAKPVSWHRSAISVSPNLPSTGTADAAHGHASITTCCSVYAVECADLARFYQPKVSLVSVHEVWCGVWFDSATGLESAGTCRLLVDRLWTTVLHFVLPSLGAPNSDPPCLNF